MKKANDSLVHFEVKSGVQIPAARSANKKYDWPLDKMEVGQSFMVPCRGAIDGNYRVRALVYNAAKEFKREGRRFITRLMPNDKEVGVWRIA